MQVQLFRELIQRRRKDLGWTQEYASEGICEQYTLSRIETGDQNPSYKTVKALLEKLGLPEARYYALLSDDELILENLQTETKAQVVKFSQAAPEEKPRQKEKALELLCALREKTAEDDHLTRQFIMGLEVVLGGPEGPYSLEKQRSMLTEAIRLTVPRFNFSDLGDFFYTKEEIQLILQLAIAYAEDHQTDKAFPLYRQLLRHIQKQNQPFKQYVPQLTMVAFNYALALNKEGGWEESAEIAQMGRKACVDYGHYQFLPGLLALLANCHSHLGNREESLECYYRAYYFYKELNQLSNLAHLRNDAFDTLGIELPKPNPIPEVRDPAGHPEA